MGNSAVVIPERGKRFIMTEQYLLSGLVRNMITLKMVAQAMTMGVDIEAHISAATPRRFFRPLEVESFCPGCGDPWAPGGYCSACNNEMWG